MPMGCKDLYFILLTLYRYKLTSSLTFIFYGYLTHSDLALWFAVYRQGKKSVLLSLLGMENMWRSGISENSPFGKLSL